MQDKFNRRDLIIGLAATALLARVPAAFAQSAPMAAAPAQSTPPSAPAPIVFPGISIGEWQIPGPSSLAYSNETQAAQPKQKGFIGRMKQAGSQIVDKGKQTLQGGAELLQDFLHLYLNVNDNGQNYQIHALPVDPITGQVRGFNDLKDAKLTVFILTDKEAADLYFDLRTGWKHDLPKLPARQMPKLSDTPVTATLGKILDFAYAVNTAKLPYDQTTLDTTILPLNDNAFIAGALWKVGVCQAADKCPELESLNKGFHVSGVNSGLATNKLVSGMEMPMFEGAGQQKGSTVQALVMQFKQGSPVLVPHVRAAPPQQPPAQQPGAPAPQ